ncbi:hypothetical protein THARTR1_01696 [Trichoderma harzianum]|uniref:Uncharacterized protein n=1 Tax=Trichoderma harzianum TaxID=5544 RepID=A0A2K0ULM5_TRIHA|nr:hypothetical protein THARTR1_01696 [Trichoderma harzianum]
MSSADTPPLFWGSSSVALGSSQWLSVAASGFRGPGGNRVILPQLRNSSTALNLLESAVVPILQHLGALAIQPKAPDKTRGIMQMQGCPSAHETLL